MESPTCSANVSEIMFVVSPKFSAAYAALADYLEAFLAHPRACNTSLLSANSTVTSNFAVLDY
jgi:hypothetical protein